MKFDLVYHCDAHPAIGMGHLKRGLDILEELRGRRPILDLGLAGSFTDSARAFLASHLPLRVEVFGPGDVRPAARVAVFDTMADPSRPEVLDHSRAVKIGATAGRLVLISSARTVRLSEAVDVLIDHMPAVEVLGAVPRRQYLGLEYAPVSKEFVPEREEAGVLPRNLLAVIGGNDVQDGPALLLNQLDQSHVPGFDGVEVIVSPHFPAPNLEELRALHPGARILQNVASLRPHLLKARAVICTYGNITYESLTLHRPTFVVAYKDFQQEYASELERLGLVVNLGRFGALDRNKMKTLASGAALEQLSERAAAVFEKPGIGRIASVLEEEIDSVSDA